MVKIIGVLLTVTDSNATEMAAMTQHYTLNSGVCSVTLQHHRRCITHKSINRWANTPEQIHTAFLI